MRPTIARLKQTHGRAGQPPMPAAFDPEPEDDDITSVAADMSDIVSPMVAGERPAIVHLLMLDALYRAMRT